MVDFPDDSDERLKNEVFSGGARFWPESPKLVYGCDWENFREFLLGRYKEWLIEGCELLTFFGNDACGKRLIEPREAVARHPTLRDWLNNGPIRSFDPVEDSTPPILRPSFPSWEKRSQGDVSMQLEKFAAGEAARKVTNRNALVSWKLRIDIGRFFGARYHSGDERASGAFLRLNKAIDEGGFLKALMARCRQHRVSRCLQGGLPGGPRATEWLSDEMTAPLKSRIGKGLSAMGWPPPIDPRGQLRVASAQPSDGSFAHFGGNSRSILASAALTRPAASYSRPLC